MKLSNVDAVALERIFAEASEVATAERSAFLTRACGGDERLRRAVEALLVHSDDAREDGFLRGSALNSSIDDNLFAAGTALGERYVIERQLGEGGMGTVYLAEQIRPFKRRVALKVIRSGLLSRDAALRFDLERQALALMSHPNIATVYDAGITPDGRPYVVMEYVEGTPITTFARETRASTDEKLDLMLEVCAAVQHAHQKGILHRDLKPSNVLVAAGKGNGERVVKVIDFGIAKVIESQQGPHPDPAVTSALFGTPTYMSPEQFERCADIDTRSDVFGLGATMYELLCAAPPFDAARLAAATLPELLRIMREEIALRPSERAQSSRDAAALRGDLDWITMKAMEKDRDRRYESAAALAEDIRRHRRSEPVEAGPPSALYRVGKFVRRRRGVVAATTVTLVALLTGLALALWQERVASNEAETARAVTGFIQDMFRSIDPAMARGETITVLDVLNTSAPQVDTRFAGRPLVLASLHWTIGSTYRAIGEFVPAEKHLRYAIALFEEHRGRDHPNTFAAWSDLAYLLKESSRLDEAERIARAQLERATRVQGPTGKEVLALKTTLATTLLARDEHKESGALFREVYDAHVSEQGERGRESLLSMTNLGVWLMDTGKPAEAQPIFERALALCEELHGADHPATLATVENVSTVLDRQQRYEQALPNTLRAHRDSSRVLGAAHPLTLFRGRNLVIEYMHLNRPKDAEDLARSLVELSRTKHGPEQGSTIGAVEILVTVIGIQGRLEEAETIALNFYEDVARAAGPVDERTARVAHLLVELYDEWKKDDQKQQWQARERAAQPERTRDKET